ncbi:hypothetical protein C0991_010855 [Blastosporella zonata]|nr:hypothetical protein C0991_010855 [Blastosporella zonata]
MDVALVAVKGPFVVGPLVVVGDKISAFVVPGELAVFVASRDNGDAFIALEVLEALVILDVDLVDAALVAGTAPLVVVGLLIVADEVKDLDLMVWDAEYEVDDSEAETVTVDSFMGSVSQKMCGSEFQRTGAALLSLNSESG